MTSRTLAALALVAVSAAVAACEHLPAVPLYAREIAPFPCGQIPAADLGPTPIAGFGCANQSNLAMMVADPRELEHPATAAAPRGDGAVAAAQRHRTGKAKPLPAVVGSAFSEKSP